MGKAESRGLKYSSAYIFAMEIIKMKNYLVKYPLLIIFNL